MNIQNHRALLLASTISLAFPLQSGAQSLTLEEIVVTAQKRAESLQDVPIAITAFTYESIQRLGFTKATDIVSMTPNLNIRTDYGSSGANIFMRGVGDASFHVNQVGAVGIYLDEVSLNSPAVNMFQVFDLERIEILRGPQNTLYGRNTTGGAINFITRKPDPDAGYNGDFSLTYGRFNQLSMDAAFGVPVTDNSALRIAVTSTNRDGWMRNAVLDAKEREDQRYAGRIQYLVRPSETFEILVNAHGGVNRGDTTRWKAIGQFDPVTFEQCPFSQASVVGGGCGNMFGFVDSGNWRESFAEVPNPRDRVNSYGGFVSLTWALDAVTVTSLSAYEGSTLKRNEDSDSSPFGIFEFYQQQEQDQYSQELRVSSATDGPFQWIAGGYFFKEELAASTTTALRFAGAGGSTQIEQDDELWSVYGQGSYALTDQLKFTLGGRYSVEKKSGLIDPFRYDPTALTPGIFIGGDEVLANAFMVFDRIVFDDKWKEWGGSVGLDYTLNDDAMVYAKVSRGFKGGGINFGAQQAFSGFGNFAVDPEYLTTYEAGAKTSWLDGRLRANLALFLSKFKDQQVFQPLQDGTPLLTNAAKSTIKGGEFELNWSPDETWLVMFGAGYTDAKFDDFAFAPTVNYRDNKLLSSPSWNLSGLVRKQFQIGDNLLGLQVSSNYVSSQEYDVGNDPRMREPGHVTVNARASYEFGPSGNYVVEVWGANILNEKYCVSRVDLSDFGLIQCGPSMPATYGLTFRYRFGN